MNKAVERPGQKQQKINTKLGNVNAFAVNFHFWLKNAEYGEIDAQKQTVYFNDRQLAYDFINYLDTHKSVIFAEMTEVKILDTEKIYKSLPRVEDFDRS